LTKAPSPFNGDVTCRNEGFIKFKVEVDIDDAYAIIDEIVLKGSASTPHVQLAIEDSYKRLLNHLMKPARSKAKADANSIQVFANNLGQLLLAPPLGENDFSY
jgi:uncharacterized protein